MNGIHQYEEHCIRNCGFDPCESRHPEREETPPTVVETTFRVFQTCLACDQETVRMWSPMGPVCMECGARLAG